MTRQETNPAVGQGQESQQNLLFLPIDRLQFDSTNPRIIELLGDSPSQDEIERMLVGGSMKARELVPSFIENGFIPYEPLIVKPKDGDFIVIEGNRRLAAIRSMRDSEDEMEKEAFERHSLDRVPCLVFRGEENQLLAYLGLRHLSKTKDWSTNAKGAFVERILNQGHDLQKAAKLTNTTTNALRLILLTRRLFEQSSTLGIELSTSGAVGETTFWHLGDAIRRTRTRHYLALQENTNPLEVPTYDQTKYEYLIGYLYGNPKTGQQRVISSIRDIKDLDQCLGNKRAIDALESGALLSEAKEELEAAGASVRGHLDRAKRSVSRATGGISEVDREGLTEVEVSSGELRDAVDQFESALDFRKNKLERENAE